MARLKVLAGSLDTVEWSLHANPYDRDCLLLASWTSSHPWKGEKHTWQLARVERVSEDKLRSMTKTALWAGVGALALGPVGLLAGFLGGKRVEIVVEIESTDGKRILAVTDAEGYKELVAAAFKNAPVSSA